MLRFGFAQAQFSGFIENRGQIIDQFGVPNQSILYSFCGSSFRVQLRLDGFNYEVYKTPSEITKPLTYEIQRIEVDFENSGADKKIIASESTGERINYYTNGSSVTGVEVFRTVTYKDVYPGIDVEFLVDEANGFKFNIHLNPGADIKHVRLLYRGITPTIQNNKIILNTISGSIEEEIPYSYQFKEGKRIPRQVSFIKLEEQVVGLVCKDINRAWLLVVDPKPSLVWATYYGGSGLDVACENASTLIADNRDNQYTSGVTSSTSNIATSGAFKTSIGGTYDGVVVKFNRCGKRIWSTYFGGSGNETNYGGCLDANANIYIGGVTSSTSGVATTGAAQTSLAGADDAYVFSFDSSGKARWATYFGGSNKDESYDLSYGNGHIYMTGLTHSSGLGTTGTHQSSHGGSSDLFLVKFDTSGSKKWCTYLGGNDWEAGRGVKVDKADHIYVTGLGRSASSIASTGAYQTSHAGNLEAFLAKFNSSGIRLWSTYYGGSSDDEGNSLAIDADNNIYFAGQTSSSSGIATSNGLVTSISTAPDGFIAKFDSSGKRLWGTYYGGSSGDVFRYITNYKQYVYACGATSSSSLSTTGAYQTSVAGGTDAILLKIDTACKIQWATYYGGGNTDVATGLCYSNNSIYVNGYTVSTSGIATTGAHQTTYGGGSQDIFIARFVDTIDVVKDSILSNVASCGSGDQVFRSLDSSNVFYYKWEYPTGWTLVAGQGKPKVTLKPDTTSGYVKLTIIDSCANTTRVVNKYFTIIDTVKDVSYLDSFCYGDSILFRNKFYKDTGEYVVNTGSTACDTTFHLKFSYISTDTTTDTQVICKGDSIQVNGNYYLLAGEHLIRYKNNIGCDSIVKMTLNYRDLDTTGASYNLCYGDSLVINNHVYKSAGTFFDTLYYSVGCDSMLMFQLAFIEPDTTTDNQLICEGDSIEVSGNYYKLSGEYLISYKNQIGCDSFVRMTLSYRDLDTVISSYQICNGDSLVINGHSYKSSGTFFDTLKYNIGCDSILKFQLSVVNVLFTGLVDTICPGDTLSFNGTKVYEEGIYTDTLSSKFGCDSVVELTLRIYSIDTTYSSITICPDDSLLFNGSYYKVAGVSYHIFTNKNGCDSVVELTLNLFEIDTTSASYTICPGDSLLSNGIYFKTSGIHYQVLDNRNGCDSILEITIDFFTIDTTTVTDQICANDSLLFHGQYYKPPGSYTYRATASNGCDSVLILNLSSLPYVTSNPFITRCEGDSIFFGNKYLKVTGTYTDTMPSQNGCDSIVALTLLFNPTQSDTITERICDMDSVLVGNNYYTEVGTYIIYDTNTNGCDSNTILFILKHPAPNVTIIQNQTLLRATPSFPFYQWFWNSTELPGADQQEYETYDSSGDYSVVIRDQNGCYDTSGIYTYQEQINYYVPNIFTPNGDGKNDVFKPVFTGIIEGYYFLIIDRWGEILFETTDINTGWDGTYKGYPVQDGIYCWEIGFRGKRKRYNDVGYVNISR